MHKICTRYYDVMWIHGPWLQILYCSSPRSARTARTNRTPTPELWPWPLWCHHPRRSWRVGRSLARGSGCPVGCWVEGRLELSSWGSGRLAGWRAGCWGSEGRWWWSRNNNIQGLLSTGRFRKTYKIFQNFPVWGPYVNRNEFMFCCAYSDNSPPGQFLTMYIVDIGSSEWFYSLVIVVVQSCPSGEEY